MQLRHVLTTLTLSASLFGAAHATPIAIPGQGNWTTTLQARDLNGDGTVDAFYDTSLNITWLANGNLNGAMSWGAAQSWAAGLNIGGYAGWQLPTIVDVGNNGAAYCSFSGSDCGYNVDPAGSQLAHLFSLTLGNLADFDTSGTLVNYAPGQTSALTNSGPFTALQEAAYWSATPDPTAVGYAWYFDLASGQQNVLDGNTALFAIAVHAGDIGRAVAVLPEPAAPALVLGALGALALVSRRRLRH